MPLVETELDGGVFTITLSDPQRRNALSRALLAELRDAIGRANGADVRVVVVTNLGSVFCAGADLTERSTPGAGPMAELSEILRAVLTSPKPYVGRIMGHCVAGGVGLAAAMDISLALEGATFGFSEVRVGVAPAMISVVCLAKMRPGDARSAFLRGNRFDAVEAARLGLVTRAVPEQDMAAELSAVVNDLLAGEPGAIAASKELVRRVPAMDLDEAFAWTTRLSGELFSREEAREGMAAFLEKRPAAWVGRWPAP
jgi:methylglutaconyl-CoA hydratase